MVGVDDKVFKAARDKLIGVVLIHPYFKPIAGWYTGVAFDLTIEAGNSHRDIGC